MPTTTRGWVPAAENDDPWHVTMATMYEAIDTDVNGAIAPSLCDGRLTLASGDAIPLADQTAKTNIYFTPFKGNRIGLHNGTRWNIRTFSEVTIPLGTLTTLRPYDVYVFDNAGTVTGELLAWTNDTTRATGLALLDGAVVKSGATTRRYLGTMRTTSTTTTESSLTKRFLWNYHNRLGLEGFTSSSAGHSYGSATVRYFNNNAALNIEWILGVAEEPALVTYWGRFTPSTTAARGRVGFGWSSSSSFWSYTILGAGAAAEVATGSQYPLFRKDGLAAGYHFVTALEAAPDAVNVTFSYLDVGLLIQG